jgi:hypothetical protein
MLCLLFSSTIHKCLIAMSGLAMMERTMAALCTLSHNDTGHVDAVKPLPKISKENLVNWQHTIGAPVPSNQSFILSTPMVEGASTTLINLLMRLVDNTPPSKCIPIVEGSRISCTINNIDQLLYPLPPFEM